MIGKDGHIKKFILHRGNIVLLALLCLLCLCISVYLDYLETQPTVRAIEAVATRAEQALQAMVSLDEQAIEVFNSTEASSDSVRFPIMLSFLRTFLLIMCSLLGANVLMSALIEVKAHNKTVTDFFLNDVITTPSFYNNISEQKRIEIFNSLEANLYFKNNTVMEDMHKRIRDKMKVFMDKDYYYESYSYYVDVKVVDGFFEKTVIRTIEPKCYEEGNLIVDRFNLVNVNRTEIDAGKSFELTRVTIDSKDVALDKIGSEDNGIINSLSIKSGYNKVTSYYLKDPITLSNTVRKKIVVYSTVRCPIDDIVASYGTALPCKKFIIDYTIDSKAEYRLVANAFGFMDNAASSTNINNRNVVKIEYDDFVFPNGGVAITSVKIK